MDEARNGPLIPRKMIYTRSRVPRERTLWAKAVFVRIAFPLRIHRFVVFYFFLDFFFVKALGLRELVILMET